MDRPPAISIHALREEGDPGRSCYASRGPISIHALREEGDLSTPSVCAATLYFYPRPPRGGRQDAQQDGRLDTLISIHALREEGDSAFAMV